MRHSLSRFAALVAAVAVVASCDDGPTSSRFGNGISGGPTGTAPIVPPAPGSVDSFPPFARILTPVATPVQLINIGDSIFVEVRVSDDRELRDLTITGFKEVGDPDLGTFQRIARYRQIRVPVSGAFRAGLTDTTVRRYLQPATPVDTLPDDLIIEAVVTDAGGNTFTAQRIINLVTGPTVRVISPAQNSEHPRGVAPLRIDVSGEHNTGLDEITITVTGDAALAGTVDTTFTYTFGPGTLTDTVTMLVPIPATAPLGSRITINASAIDVNGNPGSAAPVIVRVREAGLLAPRVTQVVEPRLEIDDFIQVHAEGDGITSVGYVLVDAVTGVEFKRYSEPTDGSSPQNVQLPLALTLAEQGRRFKVYSFAVDNNTPPLTGFSLANISLLPIQVEANAFRDTTLIAHGRTYKQPRSGVIGDVAVDPLGNVFLSNTQHNLLEVWQNPVDSFATSGIRVGALPWGLFLASNPDTLLVANSGATTISRVFVGTSTATSMQEDLPRRIRTRETVVYDVLLSFDIDGDIILQAVDQWSYSDRPQYVAESEGGRIYYSTRPTSAATPGTIRWMQPNLPFPDPQQIVSYGTGLGPGPLRYSIFNADSIRIGANNGVSPLDGSDTLVIYDHLYGDTVTIGPFADSIPLNAAAAARAGGSDVYALFMFDVASLALTDTTFVAASGDRRWIGFGEGNTEGGTGRIMMINDPVGPTPGFFSPAITVRDIVHNASEKVFGLALDSTGLQAVSHGAQTYMSAIDQPFHLRLEGVYDSFDNGAGVAYHPRARSTLTANADHRISFSATDNGVIEVIDVAHYNNRGRLTTKGNLYGPLRVSGPLPGDNGGLSCATGTRAGDDPDCIVLKIFGLSSSGLVVINVQWKDIAPQ